MTLFKKKYCEKIYTKKIKLKEQLWFIFFFFRTSTVQITSLSHVFSPSSSKIMSFIVLGPVWFTFLDSSVVKAVSKLYEKPKAASRLGHLNT